MSNGKKSAPEWHENFVATARRIFPGRVLSFVEPITERDALHVELNRWIASANQSFIAAKPQQQLVLRHAVETARATQPARIWNDLLFLIR